MNRIIISKAIVLLCFAHLSVANAEASQTITCSLQFPDNENLEAAQSVEVKNGEARLTGQSRNFRFGFSVAGKTGLGKLADQQTGQGVVAKGAIEMLSHGGRSLPSSLKFLKKGEGMAGSSLGG